MRSTSRRCGVGCLAWAAVLSAGVHALLVAAPAVTARVGTREAPPALARVAPFRMRAAEVARTAALFADRRDIVARARADRAAGRLRLGDFLLDASAIDDHLRPWGSSYDLEDGGDSAFARGYRVFRVVAWGLWEAARPEHEILSRALAGAASERLERASIAAIVDYYARNALGLHRSRDDGPTVARTLARWMEEHAFTGLEAYRAAMSATRRPG